MSQLTIWTIFALAFIVTLLRGVGWAFVLVYLPSMILLNQLPEIQIAHAPLAAHFAPLYAMVLAMPFRGDSLRFKWSSIDTIVVLLLCSSTLTAWLTEYFETGINNFRTELMTWVAPYFFARIVFRSLEIRRAALFVLIGLVAILSVSALIEFRLYPYFYLHMLQMIGMGNRIQSMAYSRFGFFRVSASVEHPIYFGNMCLVLLGLVAVLAKTTGASLKNPWVALALFGAFGCIVTSISFTPYVGVATGIGFFFILMSSHYARAMLLPLTLAVIAVIFTFTYSVAHSKIGPKPDSDLGGSLWTRKQIISQSWQKAASAGAFGFGRNLSSGDAEDEYDLKSVDNSYMLFTMSRGWVYTTLWLSIAVFFSVRMTRAFNAATSPSQIFPLAAGTATVLGLMVSMYTVWAGALYVVVWAVMLGLVNALMDLVLESSQSPISATIARHPQAHPVIARPLRQSDAAGPMIASP